MPTETSTTYEPRDEAELGEIVTAALANGEPLDLIGGGTRDGLGRPTSAATRVSLRAIEGIEAYEPSELFVAARAGTPLRLIIDLLDQHGQELAFEPIDYGQLYDGTRDGGTIGGLVATNASGPRRIKAGAARDHLLGFRAVSGRGEVFQSGGRVMKNVTGYDLSKLMAGAFGTLGILSTVTLKVLPKAEARTTLAVVGLSDEAAVDLMTHVSGLPSEVSGLAHLPARLTMPNDARPLGTGAGPVTLLRLEGPNVSVRQRCNDLKEPIHARIRKLDQSNAEIVELDDTATIDIWAAVRDCLQFAGTDDQVWRISTAPTEGAALVADIKQSGVDVSNYFFDWAGGLVWLAVAPSEDASATAIRAAVDARGGHATLVRAAATVRSAVPVFHPQPQALAALSARVKHSFDPERILNRGRMRSDL